jgi:tetratricopeptide (TPR) repeat protein
VREVLELLQAQRETERLFVSEAEGKSDASKGWSPAMVMFHVALWRERLWNALADATEGRPVNAPPGDVDELNDAEMAGAAGVSLADAAARSDAALTSLLAMWETMGDQPFKWYMAETISEALVRNSYLHPRIHLSEQFLKSGDMVRGQRILEESASEMRRLQAPRHILGAALYDLAGVRAAQGREDEALALLEEALPMRPDLKAAAATESDLAPLRDTPRFHALVVDQGSSRETAPT